MTIIELEKNDVLFMDIRESGMKSPTCLFEEYLELIYKGNLKQLVV